MSENFTEYKERINGYIGDHDPLDLQAGMPERLASLISSVAQEILTFQPGPGKWCILEIIAHLADDELVGAYRIRTILSDPGCDIQAFDQALWAERGKYRQIPSDGSLALFRELRLANLRLFHSLDPHQWDYYGMHAERGQESIRDIARYYAGHDINHLRQIQAILDQYA